MKAIYISDRVWIKLTERGLDLLEKYFSEMRHHPVMHLTDKDIEGIRQVTFKQEGEWYEISFHRLLQIFGKYVGDAQACPFKDGLVHTEKPF